jgi:hypothetical protein
MGINPFHFRDRSGDRKGFMDVKLSLNGMVRGRRSGQYQSQEQKRSADKSIPVYMMHRIASVANLTRPMQFSLQENDLFLF